MIYIKSNKLNKIFKSSIIENSKIKSDIEGGVQVTALNGFTSRGNFGMTAGPTGPRSFNSN